MSQITKKIQELYPDGLSNVRIAINSASAPARSLAIGLFELGATVIVADPDINNGNALSKVLFERSGSKFRYFPVSFSTIHLERADVFIKLNPLVEGAQLNVKHRIEPESKASSGSK